MSDRVSAQPTHEEELERAIREIRERVLARYPSGIWHGLELPDFTPVLEARDQAAAKVASIGKVNPRAGGVLNGVIQRGKRMIARGLGWFVRDQVDFNYAMVRSLDSVLDGLNAINRTLKTIPPRFEPPIAELRREAQELKDIRAHWLTWRREWEEKLARNEIQFLRAVADLQNAYAQRVAVVEQRFEERTGNQHRDFEGALARANAEMQERFWRELREAQENVRNEYERVIREEFRSLRKHSIVGSSAAPPSRDEAMDLDWVHFANKFRGDAEKIRAHFSEYLEHFKGCSNVLDIGCGRGEFLSLLK
jgi:O-antigen chain-terminating methyltransferase